jgi:hypothetical protein
VSKNQHDGVIRNMVTWNVERYLAVAGNAATQTHARRWELLRGLAALSGLPRPRYGVDELPHAARRVEGNIWLRRQLRELADREAFYGSTQIDQTTDEATRRASNAEACERAIAALWGAV